MNMPKYIHTVKFHIDFVGDYGTVDIESDEDEIGPHDLYEMALEHFQPDAEVIDTEIIDEAEG
jgi:hypothetical protein